MTAKKILLVEDEDFIRDLYKRQLALSGYQTDAVAKGKQAFEKLSDQSYDLILLDIMLPDMNGLAILKNIKEDTRIARIPVIILTNLGQDNIIEEGFKLGAQGYIIKASYTPDEIVQKVKNILKE